jgi:hypothetical protein
MGCDFYTYYKVCIECKDGSVKEYILEDTRERRYFYEITQEWDEDFETEWEFAKRRNAELDEQIDRVLADNYKTKELYKDGKWLCLHQAVEKYKKIFTDLEVGEDTVVRVWKQGGAHMR